MNNGASGEGEKQAFRERLTEGQIVYLAEPDNILGARNPDFNLVVKKASVTAASGRHYPFVIPWEDLTKEPTRGMNVSKSPRELFTTDEIKSIAERQGEFKGREIDDLIADPATNRRLAIVLSEETRERMGDDFTRNPKDPEA